MKARGSLCAVAVFLGVLAFSAIPPAAAVETEAIRLQSGPAIVGLGGVIPGYRWRLTITRDSGKRFPRRPCVSAGLRPVSGTTEAIATACHPLLPYPLLVGNSAGEGAQRRSLVGMAFPPRVAKARVWLRGRGDRLLPLRVFPAGAARKAGIVPFNYGAITFSGATCLERVVALDAAGAVVGPKLVMHCAGELR